MRAEDRPIMRLWRVTQASAAVSTRPAPPSPPGEARHRQHPAAGHRWEGCCHGNNQNSNEIIRSYFSIIICKSPWNRKFKVTFVSRWCHDGVMMMSGWHHRDGAVTHTLQLSPGEEAGQQQHSHGDGQQQHEGERQRRCCRHDDPQERQTGQLDESEQVHP